MTVNWVPIITGALGESIQVTGGVKLEVYCNWKPTALVGHESVITICSSTIRDAQFKFGRQSTHDGPADTTSAIAAPQRADAHVA